MKITFLVWPMALAATGIMAAPQITITHTPVPRAANPHSIDSSSPILPPGWSLSESLPTNNLPTATLPTSVLFPTASTPFGSGNLPTATDITGRPSLFSMVHKARAVAGSTTIRGPPPIVTAKATTTISYTSDVDFSTKTTKKKVF
ncbi:hypothetical protein B0T22DRAFT_535927 [Podospora appendiculata]|uniref:Uncharacterized protein n=1 Tax=Podospora appendiculata TaxID=314037 RepID=A0AAE1CCY3_9PEZI|nr:hypothetical protein B0T22DRAFT_535927 [Podospora appendiculata]